MNTKYFLAAGAVSITTLALVLVVILIHKIKVTKLNKKQSQKIAMLKLIKQNT